MIAAELKRAFSNRMFIVAIIIGLTLAFVQLLTVVVPFGLGDEWSYWRSGSKGSFPMSLFNSWIGATPYSIWSILYFFILPLIACIPFADSLYADIKSGFVANVVSRAGVGCYFRAKGFAVFLTGGIVGIIPLLINLLGTALLVPVLQPEATAGTFFVSPGAILSDLFYTLPWFYVGFFIALNFIVCGLVACSCLVFTYLVSNRFMVLIAPFLVCAIAYFILGDLAGYSPINLLNPAQSYNVELPWVLGIYGLFSLTIITFITLYCRRFEAL